MKKSTCFMIGVATLATALSASGGVTPILSPRYALMSAESSARSMRTFDQVDPGYFRVAASPSFSLRKTSGGVRKISELAGKMKPGKVQTYGWEGDWIADDLYEYEYDSSGNVTKETSRDAYGEYTCTVSSYNENGMVTYKETKVSSNGTDYENNKKIELEYDPILTKVITARTEWMWIGGEWQAIGNCYRRIIDRNDKGDITNVTIAVLFNGIYDPTQRLTVTYGADGKATSISEEQLTYDYDKGEYYWLQGAMFTDITWENTDGQIYDIDDIFIGGNRIKTGVYRESAGLEMPVSVDYAADSDAYKVNMTFTEEGMTLNATTEYTPLENDGYIAEMKTEMMGFVLVKIKEELRYDDWGLMTLQETTTEAYGSGSGYDSIMGAVEYDQEGKPLVYTVTEEYSEMGDDQVMTEYVIKADYSDYVDVTAGVSGIFDRDSSDTYYDLNGVRMTAPRKGGIIVTGSGTKKIFR